ncbi:extracellular solute-binding protein [Microtetraspora sp. NBRC 16547]|uniref:extracellular solute-binding protein n=1 Tax=Microtetraspora sp. NBRC 16547 TaxID=3030993 RepID=UPI0024A4168C|nr:extracellular solute-binding protein [Microtetraspora sp. NBRC 16547]GLW98105.1 spermidine/putrescine ABC transporter substrate-binding protein [Microtetraspora sp. NBRC 16547]
MALRPTRRLAVAVPAALIGLLAAACGTTEATTVGIAGGIAGGMAAATTAATPEPATARASQPHTAPSALPGPRPAAARETGGPGTASATPSKPVKTPTPVASAGPGEGTVDVLALPGYAEWGGTDPKVNWVTPFQASTGCKVNLRGYDAAATAAGTRPLDPGSFDVIAAPPELAGKLIDEGTVAPLNTSLITAYHDIPKQLRRLERRKGDVYGVPYLWGINEVLYDTTKEGPKTAAALYGGTGKVMLKDSPLTIADAALVLKRRGADIEDPFQLTPSQLDDAIRLLSRGASPDRVYWRDPIEVIQGFASGSVRLAQATPYHRDVLALGGRPVEAAGGPVTGWADAWMVSSSAAHPSCAYEWLDWTSSTTVQKEAAEWTGLAPANQVACTGRTKRICADYESFDDVYFASRPSKDCGGGKRECAGYGQWVERWKRLVG